MLVGSARKAMSVSMCKGVAVADAGRGPRAAGGNARMCRCARNNGLDRTHRSHQGVVGRRINKSERRKPEGQRPAREESSTTFTRNSQKWTVIKQVKAGGRRAVGQGGRGFFDGERRDTACDNARSEFMPMSVDLRLAQPRPVVKKAG